MNQDSLGSSNVQYWNRKIQDKSETRFFVYQRKENSKENKGPKLEYRNHLKEV